jgi:uncharacterized protein
VRVPRGWRRPVAVVLLTVLVSVTGCSVPGRDDGPAPAHGVVLISTGTTGGVYHAWGMSLADQLRATAPGLRVRVETSVGSVSNLRRVALGVADLGLTTMDATEDPPDGCRVRTAGNPADHAMLRALARVYDDYVQVVVRDGSRFRTLGDLAGRPVAVGSTGSGTALVACRLLGAAGVRVDERPINVAPGLDALLAGKVDAVIWSGGLPTRAIQDTATRAPLRLLPLGGLADTLRTRYGAVYRPATVPSGYYGSREQVTTLASPNLLVARADADAATVEAVLEAMFRRRDEIAAAVPAAGTTDRRTAVFTGSLPLHPAAVDYYRRQK